MSKYIKLSGRALALAETIAKDVRTTNAQIEDICEVAKRQVTQLNTGMAIRVKDMLTQLFEEVGIPPELREQFNVNNNFVDTHDSYLTAETEAAVAYIEGRVPAGRVLN